MTAQANAADLKLQTYMAEKVAEKLPGNTLWKITSWIQSGHGFLIMGTLATLLISLCFFYLQPHYRWWRVIYLGLVFGFIGYAVLGMLFVSSLDRFVVRPGMWMKRSVQDFKEKYGALPSDIMEAILDSRTRNLAAEFDIMTLEPFEPKKEKAGYKGLILIQHGHWVKEPILLFDSRGVKSDLTYIR